MNINPNPVVRSLVLVYKEELIMVAEYKFSANDENRQHADSVARVLDSSELFYRGLVKWAEAGPGEAFSQSQPFLEIPTFNEAVERERSLATSEWKSVKGENEIKIGGEDGIEGEDKAESEDIMDNIEGGKTFEDNNDIESEAVTGGDDKTEDEDNKKIEEQTGDGSSEVADPGAWEMKSITGLSTIWQCNVINPMTRKAITLAHKEKQKSMLCWGKFKRSSKGKDEREWKHFKRLLATDNGRPVFMMLNDHREELGHKEIQEIWTFPPGSVLELDCFHMILLAGPAKEKLGEKSVEGIAEEKDGAKSVEKVAESATIEKP